jgi:hypothetical protein
VAIDPEEASTANLLILLSFQIPNKAESGSSHTHSGDKESNPTRVRTGMTRVNSNGMSERYLP